MTEQLTPTPVGDWPSRRARLRDGIVNALGQIKTVPPVAHRREQADHVLALLYREWPWLQAEAEELDQARAELLRHAEAESAAAAAGSYANGNEHAIAHPQPWLHILFTSPDPTTANTSALNLRDHLAAEFPGVGMRISSNAVEVGKGTQIASTPDEPDEDPAAVQARLEAGEKGITAPPSAPSCSASVEETEPNNPAATQATDLRTRVTALHEQWVKAGPPPLGTSTARWWDRRLVELGAAIHGAGEQSARTTANNPPTSEEQQP